MKYGVIPTSFLERLALRSGKVSVPAIDALFSIMKARTLMAGVRLGIFEKIDDIVTHRAGDLRVDEFGAQNDVVLLSNILHHFSPETVLDILGRALRSLNRDGTAAVWEVEAPDKDRRPGEGDGSALFFRLTSNARCYSASEYAGWLKQAGFERVRVIRPMLNPVSVLVVGRAG